VILLTRFCKLLTRVATPSGGGHVPQVPQWHDATAYKAKSQRSRSQLNVKYPGKNCNSSVPGGRIKFILGS